MSDTRIQLFILPFIGGGKASFRALEQELDPCIETVTLEYPGHGTRAGEPLCSTMGELIRDARKQVLAARVPGIPFAIMGYSMGCEVVFDLLQYGLEEKAVHGIFCAREDIGLHTRGYDYALLDDRQFLDKIVALGGIDLRILNNQRFLSIALRTIRADYELLHQYEFQEEKGKLSQNLTVFYCPEDTPFCQVEGWKNRTIGHTNFYEMDGGHFFLQRHGQSMAQIITSTLMSAIQS